MERLDNIDKTLERFTQYHYEHYRHKEDDDAHWTQRERDDLAKSIDKLQHAVDELLRRSGPRP